jgi:hypothetical protein
MTAGMIWAVIAAGLGGAVFGAVYMSLLWAGASGLSAGHGAARFVLLAVARGLLVVGALGGAIALGAGAIELAAAVVGFVVVRVVAVRAAGAGEGTRRPWR